MIEILKKKKKKILKLWIWINQRLSQMLFFIKIQRIMRKRWQVFEQIVGDNLFFF